VDDNVQAEPTSSANVQAEPTSSANSFWEKFRNLKLEVQDGLVFPVF